MSMDLTAFQLFPPSNEQQVAEGVRLFLPETQAILISNLAEKIRRVCPSATVDLLCKAIQVTQSIANKEEQKLAVSKLLKCALRFEPGSFWVLYQLSSVDYITAMIAATYALRDIASTSLIDARETFLRLHVEYFLSLKRYRDSESNKQRTNKRILSLESHEFPLLGTVDRPSLVANNSWQDGIMTFLQGCLEHSSDEADQVRLHEMCEALALANWGVFMRIMRDSKLGPVASRDLSFEVIQRAILDRGLDPRKTFNDVSFVEGILQDDSGGCVSSNSRSLIAAAAAYAPDMCISMLHEGSRSFSDSLCFFTSCAEWSNAQLYEVCEFLNAGDNKERAVAQQAEFLAWISASHDVPIALLDSIIRRAHDLENAIDVIETAKIMAGPFPDISNKILRDALHRATTEKDAPAITTILDVYTYATPRERKEALCIARDAKAHAGSRIATVAIELVKLDIEEAACTLHMMGADEISVKEVLNKLSKRVVLREEKDVINWLMRIHDYANLTNDNKEYFTNLLAIRGIDNGIISSDEILRFFLKAENRFVAYCRLLESHSQHLDDSYLAKTLHEINTMSSVHDRFGANIKLARSLSRIDPRRAIPIYRNALTEASKFDSAIELEIEFSKLSDDMLSLPSEHAIALSESMLEVIKDFPQERTIYDGPDVMARLLLSAALGFWAARDARISQVLQDAFDKYSEARGHDMNTFFEVSIASACRNILRRRGLNDAREFCSTILSTAPTSVQSMLADQVSLQFRILRNNREEPLRSYGIRQQRLSGDEVLLLRSFLDACSPEGKAEAHLAISVTYWDQNPTLARQEMENAIFFADHEGRTIPENLLQEICVVFALTHGQHGLLRTLLLLTSRPGLFRKFSDHLITIAVKASPSPQQLISSMWLTLRELKEYLPEEML